ncbi:S-layer homology domain-containing protein [Cohnella hashimotonis]|uniref:S-layer homology domain-containing protein n=1 Tax=Cohnella hashimotonis TaxID=2826895 RepID=A0ABT6TJ39_9BACL|nr:S-layer homology domain-containing protein [Cohnella hashimotonis]MDI4645867.1 S-layer homology domain-containing protein [Cohnella hashimotonis]
MRKITAWMLALSVAFSLFAAGAKTTGVAAAAGALEGYITLTVEKFTLGQGYKLEPTRVPFYTGENGAAVIARVLGEENIKHTGTVDGAFYLSDVRDSVQEAHVPDYILEQIALGNETLGGRQDSEWLGEFDYTPMSGWMYEVNGEFPPVGLSAYLPHDGDVVRTQFTVWGYGADLDYSDGSGYIDSADKDELTALIGKVNGDPTRDTLLSDPAIAASYTHAYEVLENIESTQDSVDRALTELADGLGWDVVKPELAIAGIEDQSFLHAKQLSFQVTATDAGTPGIVPTVTLNGTALMPKDGQYTANLVVGANTIVVTAQDLAGNTALRTLTVYYGLSGIVGEQLGKNLAWIANTVKEPTFGTLGGEWSVLSLARGQYDMPASYYAKYYDNVVAKIAPLVAQNDGILDKSKSTEHSRLIVGLASIAKDPHHVAGFDATQALSDYDYVLKQGINGPIWALIAMDTRGYAFPAAAQGKKQATRENLIQYILNNEVKKGTEQAGGWGFSTVTADVDLTAMAMQALAPYYASDDSVRAAVDRAIVWLSAKQNNLGSFTNFGSTSSESIAQVVTALSALGIDSATDARFVKQDMSVLEALLSFGAPDGGFKHVLTGKVDSMATDQGTYALIAYARYTKSENRLYDMTDAVDPAAPKVIDLPLPDGLTPVVDIPLDTNDYSLTLYPYDQNKQVKVTIPADSESKVSLNTAADSNLPALSVTKGNVSAFIPQNTLIKSGDPSKVELLTTIDASDLTLKEKIGGIVASGMKLDSIAKAFAMGGTDRVTFDRFITLTFTGLNGKSAAYVENDQAHTIQKVADEAAGIETGKDEYAYDSGEDLIVKTKHFTQFVAYAEKSSDPSAGGGNGGTTGHVTLSIDKNTIGKGYVVAPERVELKENDTVWSVLSRVLDSKQIAYKYEFNPKYNSVYVQSIAGDGEFDHGNLSGWMYNVNGTYPDYGASLYKLKDGDSVQWRYTTDLGADLGHPYNGDSSGTGGGAGESTVVNVPDNATKDFVFAVEAGKSYSNGILVNIPDIQPKVFLDLNAVLKDMPKITVKRGDLTLEIPEHEALVKGESAIELFTKLDPTESGLQTLVRGGLASTERLKKIDSAFVLGAKDESFLFSSPVTITFKNAKDRKVGYIEDGKWTSIPLYADDAQGAAATKGTEKVAYAFVKGDNLIVKTNHFTTYVSYTIEGAESGGNMDMSKLFSDANAISSWAYDSMKDAVERGFVQGSNGKLNPKANLTRAEFAKLLVSVQELTATSGNAGSFKDVPETKWYYTYVNAASHAGLVNGYNGYFQPNDAITREQLATVIVKALNLKPATPAIPLSDMGNVSDWANADVQTVAASAFMQGQGGRFDPKGPVTREMATVVLMRAYRYKHSGTNGDV